MSTAQTIAPLAVGSRGRAVQFLQARLGVNADGIFGPNTQAALTAWQDAHSLVADGSYKPVDNTAMVTRTAQAIPSAAQAIGIEAAALRSIMDVETAGSGYLANGLPKILLERHYVWARASTSQRTVLGEGLANPKPGGYLGGISEWTRFENVAKVIGVENAAQCCSWGLGQIMGANFRACGLDNATALMNGAARNEDVQIRQMASFIASNSRMLRAIQMKNWTVVAECYNGAGQHGYDVKLAAAYKARSAQGN